ncbi:MAG: precorrin-3B C(17)-methyltransferase [Nitrospirae bacterium]|nr:precorrin-3B C(17)-methyltransferase [Nitrospirota bacterium]
MRASSNIKLMGKGAISKKAKKRKCNNSSGRGAIYIIGIGPGSLKDLTQRAKDAIKKSDIIVGYTTYIDLIKGLIKNKEVFATGMMREVERCQKAIDIALSGRKVAVVSSGDSGIYGMAGLVLELLQKTEKSANCELRIANLKSEIRNPKSEISVSIIPGVPAFCSAASLLGAPIMHDFASISLSDLLTPYEVILKRIKSAAEADFVIILYNPKSKKRVKQIEDVREILLKYRKGSTPVGIVKGSSRENEEIKITTLGGLLEYYDFIDMQTIVIIGNSSSCVYDNKIITPRGYKV